MRKMLGAWMVLFLFIFTGCSNGESYLPMTDKTYVFEIKRDNEAAGKVYYYFEKENANTVNVTFSRYDEEGKSYVENIEYQIVEKKDGLYALMDEFEIMLLKYPVEEGVTWNQDIPNQGTTDYEILSTNKTIETSYESFQDVIEIQSDIKLKTQTEPIINISYFAPNIGFIGGETEEIGEVTTLDSIPDGEYKEMK